MSSARVKIYYNINRAYFSEDKKLVLVCTIEIECENGIIIQDKSIPYRYIDVNTGAATNIRNTTDFGEYTKRMEELILQGYRQINSSSGGSAITLEDFKTSVVLDVKINLVIPKINACTAIIITSGNLTILVHLEPQQIQRDCFNNVFDILRSFQVSEINVLFSIKSGAMISYNDVIRFFHQKAEENGIKTIECINQSIYDFMLSKTEVETFGVLTENSSREPKSYYLSFNPDVGFLIFYCDDTRFDDNNGGLGLFIFPYLFSEEFILQFVEINSKSIYRYHNYHQIRDNLLFYIYHEIYNKKKYVNITPIIKDLIPKAVVTTEEMAKIAEITDDDNIAEEDGGFFQNIRMEIVDSDNVEHFQLHNSDGTEVFLQIGQTYFITDNQLTITDLPVDLVKVESNMLIFIGEEGLTYNIPYEERLGFGVIDSDFKVSYASSDGGRRKTKKSKKTRNKRKTYKKKVYKRKTYKKKKYYKSF